MGRKRLALALILLGLVGVLWGVFHVLEAANGPGTGPRTFAARRSYDQVKESLQASFFGGALRAAAGGVLIYVGARLRGARREHSERR